MAEGFGRWEADPLFSAAEVVQDSADRMESLFRLLLHEETLLQGDTLNTKQLTSIQFHRRDLVTILETTKWQLEDFEKAVQLATSCDKSNLRTNAISSFKQFIEAIREQIFQIEKSLDSMSSEDLVRDQPSMNLNDHEVDGLAQFLYGGNAKGHHIHYESYSNLASRGVDTTAPSVEIVELDSKDVENLGARNAKCLNRNESNVGSQCFKPSVFGAHSSDFHHVYLGETEDENSCDNPRTYDLETGACNTKCFSSRNKLRGTVFEPLSTFWFASMNKLTRSFTKKRKDGDATDEFIADNGWLQSSVPTVSPAEQVFVRINALWRALNNIQCSLFSVQIRMATLVAVMLIIIGLFAFRIV